MAWARILLLFEAFAGGTLRPDFETILRQALYRRYVGPRSVRKGFPCWSQSFPFIFLSF